MKHHDDVKRLCDQNSFSKLTQYPTYAKSFSRRSKWVQCGFQMSRCTVCNYLLPKPSTQCFHVRKRPGEECVLILEPSIKGVLFVWWWMSLKVSTYLGSRLQKQQPLKKTFINVFFYYPVVMLSLEQQVLLRRGQQLGNFNSLIALPQC